MLWLAAVGGACAVIVAIAVGGWWWSACPERSASPIETEEPREAPAQEQSVERPTSGAAAAPPLATISRPDAREATGDEGMDAASYPHPITSSHARIHLENQLIQQLNDAVDLRDGRQIRGLVGRYRAEGFADVDKLADGHAIIADCLEHPGESSRAAARSFYDRERGSIIRRQMRRICLE